MLLILGRIKRKKKMLRKGGGGGGVQPTKPLPWIRLCNYSQLPITRTLANLNLALTRTNIRFAVDFFYTFTVILPLVTPTNLPITRSNFHFPSVQFLHNFTLDITRTTFVKMWQVKKYSTVVQTFNLFWSSRVLFLNWTDYFSKK